LVHGDLHADNIAVRDGAPVIFDWSDACVAHPFFDLTTLLDGEFLTALPAARARLQDVYFAYWAEYEPPERLRAAAALTAPLGLLHQAVSYQHIVISLEPEARWELIEGWVYFLRQLLAALAGDSPAG
jgi:aminoglycoside phosphotransferase (APT) family kinase protein